MPNQIVPECRCKDCGQPMDTQRQADGKGGFYWLVTCWQSACLLRTVTRSLATYATLTESDLESYREMNRVREASL